MSSLLTIQQPETSLNRLWQQISAHKDRSHTLAQRLSAHNSDLKSFVLSINILCVASLVFLLGCSEVTELDEIINIDPFYNCQERITKLPKCGSSSNDKCVILSQDNAGDSLLLPYINGELTGIAVSFFADGNIKGAYTYKAGQREGLFNEYYASGGEHYSGRYQQDQLYGVMQTRYLSGATKNLTYYEHDLKHGYANSFNQTGELFSESSYHKNVLLNPIKTYKKDGGYIETYFANGSIEKAKVIDPTGEWREFTYTHSQLNGFAKHFYASGNLKRSLRIEDGYKEGININYYPNGQIQGLYRYDHGKLHGKSILFLEDGTVQLNLEFNKDQLVAAFCENGIELSSEELMSIERQPTVPNPNLCVFSRHRFDNLKSDTFSK